MAAIGTRFGTLHDAVDRHRGRAEELRAFLHRTAVPMVLMDNERRYLDANPGSRLYLRATLGELQQMSANDTVADGTADERWERFLQAGTTAERMLLRSPDGGLSEIEYTGVANVLPGVHLFAWIPADWPEGELGADEQAEPVTGRLTPRERAVMNLLARGRTTEEIADELTLSGSTVKTHLKNALRRLGARHRAQALAIAIREGEIDLD